MELHGTTIGVKPDTPAFSRRIGSSVFQNMLFAEASNPYAA
jgi:hypothetical protein